MNTDALLESLRPFADKASRLSKRLPPERQDLLDSAASDIVDLLASRGAANLLFVCTHNSRRSQFSELWAAVAVSNFGPEGVQCFSCGTEATACNIRTVESIRRSGVRVEQPAGNSENPRYRCSFHCENATGKRRRTVELFSKAFGDASLPKENIVALMCCDDADARCPVVAGAQKRVALHYVDPKHADDTPQQNAIYDERSLQIASEMFYLIQRIH